MILYKVLSVLVMSLRGMLLFPWDTGPGTKPRLGIMSVPGWGRWASPIKPGSSLRGCDLAGDAVSGVLQFSGMGCNDDVGEA